MAEEGRTLAERVPRAERRGRPEHDGGPTSRLPTYAQLLDRRDAPPGSSWHVFGRADQLGTLNLLTGARARTAAGLVRRGAVFNLDYPVGAFTPPLSPGRSAARHNLVRGYGGDVLDDYLDGYYLQVSSQFDGLRHHRHARYGFYGGTAPELIGADSPALGIQTVAQHGIVGRGVLLDVERFLREQGAPLDLTTATPISIGTLDEVARAQGIRFEAGDILLIHTGFARHALLPTADGSREGYCGLVQSLETLAWIWDHHFAVVAGDTFAVEVMPSVRSSPFADNVGRMMHPDLIALLGVHLGELWKLDDLAADCAADGVHEFLVTAKPLNVVGGVGSPANALAIK